MTRADVLAIQARAEAASHPPYSLSPELEADRAFMDNALGDMEALCAELLRRIDEEGE